MEELAVLSHLPLTGRKATKRCKGAEHAPDLIFGEHGVSTPWLLMLLGYVVSNCQSGQKRMFKAMRMLESLVMPAVAKLDNKQKKKRKTTKQKGTTENKNKHNWTITCQW